MRILHVSAQKPMATGSGVYLCETVRAFSALGAQQAVVAGVAPEDAPAFSAEVRFFPVKFESRSLPFPVVGMSDEMPYRATRYRDMDPEMVRGFYAAFDAVMDTALQSFQPDLVICHHLYLLTAHLAMREWPCPVAGVCHNTDLRQFQSHPLERDAVRAGVNRLDCVFALHDAQAREIQETFGVDPGRIAVVGAGFNDGEFHRVPGLQRPAHSLVYVGKIWAQKGVPNLLRAIDLLPHRFDDLHLDLIGGYSNPEEYAEIVAQSRQCRRSVDFRGKVSQDDLVVAYNSSAVFVLPSLSEGLPLVMLEAMACGCKVVVTDLPGIRAWMDASAPGAPVTYVDPPAWEGGAMAPGQAARFEDDLARALESAFDAPDASFDVSGLSWRGVCERMLRGLRA